MAYHIPTDANWIGVFTAIVLTFCVLIADIEVFCSVRGQTEGVGDLRLDIGGYV